MYCSQRRRRCSGSVAVVAVFSLFSCWISPRPSFPACFASLQSVNSITFTGGKERKRPALGPSTFVQLVWRKSTMDSFLEPRRRCAWLGNTSRIIAGRTTTRRRHQAHESLQATGIIIAARSRRARARQRGGGGSIEVGSAAVILLFWLFGLCDVSTFRSVKGHKCSTLKESK